MPNSFPLLSVGQAWSDKARRKHPVSRKEVMEAKARGGWDFCSASVTGQRSDYPPQCWLDLDVSHVISFFGPRA